MLGCKSKTNLLVDGEWVLKTFNNKTYTDKDREMVFRFYKDGTFYYEEHGQGQGDYNTWQLKSDTLNLRWEGFYNNRSNVLKISALSEDEMTLINEKADTNPPPEFVFHKYNSISQHK